MTAPEEHIARDPDWSPSWELVGERLRTAREYLNFSQQHVADRTGIPRTAVSDIERGTRKVDSLELRKLARFYKRPIGYFLDEDTEAAIADHAAAMLARALSPLSDGDREQVVKFAQFLQSAYAAEAEEEQRVAGERDR
ncbi:helix-turn-helix domain-containing protein [Nonomuraea sp. NEAU-A123]|uniref:helix-turn-helix domain-containing protein n=1 Tax=Nonomuraea sp. NEAU-A123 TaxID=2839649 RepID=UPI001BE3F7BD|nr:helix-turn-helix transcriptional regulator [Nonomuraea sp. NEAU-A123]MBT2234417.1 helix-turn-helix domain-containing protein [Nonomuraea sp. NEAU-A123]